MKGVEQRLGVVGSTGGHQRLAERLDPTAEFNAVLGIVWLASVRGLVQRQARRLRQCAQALEGVGADGVHGVGVLVGGIKRTGLPEQGPWCPHSSGLSVRCRTTVSEHRPTRACTRSGTCQSESVGKTTRG